MSSEKSTANTKKILDADEKRDLQISKSLSRLLRHKAVQEGLEIDSNGLVRIDDLLKHRNLKSLHVKYDELVRIVDSNGKKRFKIVKNEENIEFICALQGHSIKTVIETPDMLQLEKSDLKSWPSLILHSTMKNKLGIIKSTGGLSRMKRNHIHFTDTVPQKFINLLDNTDKIGNGNAISGVRSHSNIIILMDVEKLRMSNLQFFISDNGVILSPGDENGFVSCDFFKEILDLESGQINWEDI